MGTCTKDPASTNMYKYDIAFNTKHNILTLNTKFRFIPKPIKINFGAASSDNTAKTYDVNVNSGLSVSMGHLSYSISNGLGKYSFSLSRDYSSITSNLVAGTWYTSNATAKIHYSTTPFVTRVINKWNYTNVTGSFPCVTKEAADVYGGLYNGQLLSKNIKNYYIVYGDWSDVNACNGNYRKNYTKINFATASRTYVTITYGAITTKSGGPTSSPYFWKEQDVKIKIADTNDTWEWSFTIAGTTAAYAPPDPVQHTFYATLDTYKYVLDSSNFTNEAEKIYMRTQEYNGYYETLETWGATGGWYNTETQLSYENFIFYPRSDGSWGFVNRVVVGSAETRNDYGTMTRWRFKWESEYNPRLRAIGITPSIE